MPHLAPINWILTLVIFWSLLSLFISGFWWSQSPTLSASYDPSPLKFSPWKW